ncbi:GNS1/SUR4 family protein [Oesophagostomum dentatum]|uniref:Elongation of very long chain fatty acids protein n=1 Tax=Oesophagostomum dentatum TaxID=61180 RepID=A0A0B1T2Y0_OESDE|nr:GNS1/SUR4 family protein [Oesophagostomum dentatum]
MSSFLEVVTTFPFNYEEAKKYTQSVEKTAFSISIVYIFVIFSIKAIMSNYKPFQLTSLLNFWNAWLAIFSTIGGIITGYGLFYEIYYRGLVCKSIDDSVQKSKRMNKTGIASYTHLGDFFTGASGYLTFLFVMSKILELGDTIILVLRKKPLIFLHWYHHVLTLNYAIWSYSQDIAYNSWITWMNFSVHSIMYGYYMLRSYGIKVPAWVARNITTMQILQFVITHFILFHVGYLTYQGVKVDNTAGVYWLVFVSSRV